MKKYFLLSKQYRLWFFLSLFFIYFSYAKNFQFQIDSDAISSIKRFKNSSNGQLISNSLSIENPKKENVQQLSRWRWKNEKTIQKQKEQKTENNCEMIVYYKKTDYFPGFVFRCAFPGKNKNEHEMIRGQVAFHTCDFPSTCEKQLHEITQQPTTCWQFVERKDWDSTNEIQPTDLKPFVATCSSTRSHSAKGNFAFFGIVRSDQRAPEIYFRNEDTNASKMMAWNRFSIYQLLNTSLRITCRSSIYFLNDPPKIALKYKSKNDLKFEHGSLFVNQAQHTRAITTTLTLNDTDLEMIYCIGSQTVDDDNQNARTVSISSEIYVNSPSNPKIELEIAGYSDKKETQNGEIQYDFLVNSKNASITCHVFGYPPRNILWTSTIDDQLGLASAQFEIGDWNYTKSCLHFPSVHEALEGIYICTTTNLQEHNDPSIPLTVESKSFRLNVIKEPKDPKIWIYSGVGLSIVLAAVLGVSQFYSFRKHQKLKKRLKNLTVEEIADFKDGNLQVDKNKEADGPDDALLLPFTRIIPRDDLVIVKNSILGRGEFGIVYRGFFCGVPVGIKTIEKKVDTTYFKEFLNELKIMAYLGSHPHIVEFMGAEISNIEQRAVYAVVELSSLGNLENFLRKQSKCFENCCFDMLTRQGILRWCEQIADGMEFLVKRKVIHADLAARNVLLFENGNVVKVTDFGLSVQLYKYAEYSKKKTQNVPLPFAHMALECLTRLTFSHQSDVWAFGVTMWEIFTMGEEPFAEHTWNTKFINQIENGSLRLSKPEMADDEIYIQMLTCWDIRPEKRPTFTQLKQFFRDTLHTDQKHFTKKHPRRTKEASSSESLSSYVSVSVLSSASSSSSSH